MKKLSLFSGIGGIDLAAEWAGIETIAFCEREEFPQKVLQKNFPGIPIYDDVCTLTKERLDQDGIDTRTIDLISAGYPCQPFSHAGKRRGKEDDRHLWPEVARLIREIRPTFFLGENVAGHITMGLDDVLNDLENEGYETQTFVIPSASVGAPHKRERVFIVGYTERSGCDRKSWGRSRKEPSDRYSQLEEKLMGDSTSKRLSHWRQSRFCTAKQKKRTGTWARFERSGQVLAYTTSKRSRQTRKCESSRSEKRIAGGSKVMANSTSGRQSRSWESIKSFYSKTSRKWKAGQSINARFKSKRTVEPRLGRVLDGISRRLDEHRWPAALGEEQYDWEPPRIAPKVPDRVGRLKGLGNAVNPHQIYPVLAAIKAVHRLISQPIKGR